MTENQAIRIAIRNTEAAFYEWITTSEYLERAFGLFGKALDRVTDLSLADLCRLLFPDAPDELTGAQQIMLLSPMSFKGRNILPSQPRYVSARGPCGRIVYGPPQGGDEPGP